MYISAFLHRKELFEITDRWLCDRLLPEDPMEITRIISYDSFAAWATLKKFLGIFMPQIFSRQVFHKPISTKYQLKDFICNKKFAIEDRTKKLIADYRRTPEYYYNGSPIAAMIYHDQDQRMLSMCRFKRVNRIAEKASRYVCIHIYNEVLEAAGVDNGGKMIFDRPMPMSSLLQAEKKVMDHIRKKGMHLPEKMLAIKDVLGMKIIDYGQGETWLENALQDFSGVSILEKETHTGNYNAVHYLVEIEVDFDYLVEQIQKEDKFERFRARGIDCNDIASDFKEFLSKGADRIQIDLIMTSYDEMIESEIGRSMHETRIFEQRREQRFYGNIPKNIEYILEYLIAVGLSPVTKIDEIPIKLWGRYLPDTLSFRIRKLLNMQEYYLIEI